MPNCFGMLFLYVELPFNISLDISKILITVNIEMKMGIHFKIQFQYKV